MGPATLRLSPLKEYAPRSDLIVIIFVHTYIHRMRPREVEQAEYPGSLVALDCGDVPRHAFTQFWSS